MAKSLPEEVPGAAEVDESAKPRRNGRRQWYDTRPSDQARVRHSQSQLIELA